MLPASFQKARDRAVAMLLKTRRQQPHRDLSNVHVPDTIIRHRNNAAVALPFAAPASAQTVIHRC